MAFRLPKPLTVRAQQKITPTGAVCNHSKIELSSIFRNTKSKTLKKLLKNGFEYDSPATESNQLQYTECNYFTKFTVSGWGLTTFLSSLLLEKKIFKIFEIIFITPNKAVTSESEVTLSSERK